MHRQRAKNILSKKHLVFDFFLEKPDNINVSNI